MRDTSTSPAKFVGFLNNIKQTWNFISWKIAEKRAHILQIKHIVNRSTKGKRRKDHQKKHEKWPLLMQVWRIWENGFLWSKRKVPKKKKRKTMGRKETQKNEECEGCGRDRTVSLTIIIISTRPSPRVETVPELIQGRFHGESEGANSAYGFLFDERFAHAACHCFN